MSLNVRRPLLSWCMNATMASSSQVLHECIIPTEWGWYTPKQSACSLNEFHPNTVLVHHDDKWTWTLRHCQTFKVLINRSFSHIVFMGMFTSVFLFFIIQVWGLMSLEIRLMSQHFSLGLRNSEKKEPVVARKISSSNVDRAWDATIWDGVIVNFKRA